MNCRYNTVYRRMIFNRLHWNTFQLFMHRWLKSFTIKLLWNHYANSSRFEPVSLEISVQQTFLLNIFVLFFNKKRFFFVSMRTFHASDTFLFCLSPYQLLTFSILSKWCSAIGQHFANQFLLSTDFKLFDISINRNGAYSLTVLHSKTLQMLLQLKSSWAGVFFCTFATLRRQ